jgi:hypothetical protein
LAHHEAVLLRDRLQDAQQALLLAGRGCLRLDEDGPPEVGRAVDPQAGVVRRLPGRRDVGQQEGPEGRPNAVRLEVQLVDREPDAGLGDGLERLNVLLDGGSFRCSGLE